MPSAEQEHGMSLRDIILCVLDRCSDRPEFGRTSLQKVMYFVGRRLNRDLGHHAHFYGPFASLIENEKSTLVLSDLVQERVRELGFWSLAGFPAKQYEYALTELGRKRLSLIEERHPDEMKVIDDLINGLIKEAGQLDQAVLSAAAKVDYIAKEEARPVSVTDVGSAARDLGWMISPTQTGEVVRILSNLGFVQVGQGPSSSGSGSD